MSSLADFISRVVPWPGDGSPGFVNLHWTMPNPRNPNGKVIWSGKPTRTVEEFVKMTEWAKAKPTVRDIYYCLSLQALSGTNGRGKSKVQRSASAALRVKSVWIDIDVKEAPKGYPNLGEALEALDSFIQKAGLPKVSALIASGGGLHAYWISERSLTVDEWRPYAEGLKAAALAHGLRCDAGCTSDVARILRVPNTLNYKTNPPKGVRLLGLGLDYDFASALAGIASKQVTATVTAPAGMLGDFTGGAASAFLAKPVESLAAGIGKVEAVPLDVVPMIKECPFFQDAYVTGGKDHNQPLWNLTVLATTFLEQGEKLAHKFGDKHPGYTKESTDDMYARKARERAQNDLGWPSCASFQGEGSKFCAGCKHFNKIKSPLSLAGRPQPAAPAVNKTAADKLLLPKDYIVDNDGYICHVEEVPSEDGAVPETIIRRLFTCKLGSAHVQHNPDFLSYTATADLGNIVRVNIPFEAMATNADLCRALLRNKVTYEPKNKLLLEPFHMAWTTKLHNAIRATVAQPFGWYWENGVIRGFCYGGSIMKDDGSESPAGFGDQVTQRAYSPTGSLQPWFDACKVITDQGRPGLEALIAASFGAPLLTVTGENSGLLSAWGESGANKSSAVSVALGIWGHPKLTRDVIQTTARSATKRLGTINNLPLFWDEIKDEDTQKKVYETLYMATLGVGAGRLNTNAEQKERDTWQTMMAICANRSFVDYIVKRDKTTDAGVYRVFEYEINKPPPGFKGEIMPHEAAVVFSNLNHNFGLMGLKFSKFLAMNHKAVITEMKALQDQIYTECSGRPEERFWFAVISSSLMGAKLGNDLGCQFDLDALRKFYIEWLYKNRQRHKDEAVVGGTLMNTEEILTGFLKEYGDETLWTNTYHTGVGKPRAATPLWGPRIDLGRPIQVQWVVFDRLLRISKGAFIDYMHKKDIPPAQVIRGLKSNFNMDIVYARLAGGTPYRCGQEHIMHIPIPVGSPLEEQLLAHSAPPDIEKLRKQDEEAAPAGSQLAAAIAQANADLKTVKTVH